MNTRTLLGSLLLLLALSACGTGSTTGEGNVLVFTITDPIDACQASQVVLTGLNFLSEHGDQVTVRFEATEGTPFNGGTSAVIEVPGTAISNTQIDFLSPIALNSVSATVTIILPGGASGSSTLGQANLVAGSQSDAIAFDDSYVGIIGNVQWDSGSQSVLDNDLPGGCFSPEDRKIGAGGTDQLGLSIVTFDMTTANGGDVAMNPDGTFLYNPPAGFEGTDSFMYTMTDGSTQDSATVFLTVADVIWFIDNEAPLGGDGRMTSPLNTTAEMQAIQTNSGAIGDADEGDYIFYYGGARLPYPGQLTLLAEQHLLGNGVDLEVQGQVIVPAVSDPTLEDLSLVVGQTVFPPIVTLANGTEVRGLTINGAQSGGIWGTNVTGPILIDNVDVRNTGDSGIQIIGNPTGSMTIGDNSDSRSVIVDGCVFFGINVTGFDQPLDVTCDGCFVNNTTSDAMRFLNASATLTGCSVGQPLTPPLVAVGRHGINFESFAFLPLTFVCQDCVVNNAATNGINIEHLGEGEGLPQLTLPGAEAVPLIGFDEIDATISGCTVSGASNDGLFVSSGGVFQAILLAVSDCSFQSTGIGQAVDVQTFAFDSIIVTAFSNLTVPAGNGTSGGVFFDTVTFDADPLVGGVQPVAGGTWTLASALEPIEGTGLSFFLPNGQLDLDVLTLFCANGNGVEIETFMGFSIFTFNVTTANITAPDGVPIVSN